MQATCVVCGARAKARRLERAKAGHLDGDAGGGDGVVLWAAPSGWTTTIRGSQIRLTCKSCSEGTAPKRRRSGRVKKR